MRWLCLFCGLILWSGMCHAVGAGMIRGWSAGAGIKGVFWEMVRDFESRADKPVDAQSNEPDIIRGCETRAVRSAVGAVFVQKGLYDFFFGSLFLRLQTHISGLKWRYDGMSVYRVFEQGLRVTQSMRSQSLWGRVGEEYTIKPLRVWDILAGAQASAGPLTFNISGGARWLFLESLTKVRQEERKEGATETVALDMKKTMTMKATGSHFFAVFECVVGWKLPLFPIVWQFSASYMLPRTMRYDVDKQPSLASFYNKTDAASRATSFGTLRLGGCEVGTALTVSL